MGTIILFNIVSGISFIVNGHSEHLDPVITSTFSGDFVDDIHFQKDFPQFSGLDKTCTNETEKALYNYLTREGEEDNGIDSITIGFLGAYGSTQVVLGALPLAVEAVNKDSGNVHLLLR